MTMDPKTRVLSRGSEEIEDEEEAAKRRFQEGVQNYAQIKYDLIRTNLTQGGFIVLYLAATSGLETAGSTTAGVAGAILYQYLLQQYTDQLGKEGSWAPPTKEAREKALRKKSPFGADPGAIMASFPSRVGDVYRQALLQKRLLVPVALGVSASAINHMNLDFEVSYGFMLLGFLTYKASALTWLWQNDIKVWLVDGIVQADPQVAPGVERRPVLAKIPNADEVLAAANSKTNK
eukprot:CAMPEP_0118935422 /NCGR_PEP_ID=MMETSP1169-20130426/15634_1 /TAXON_ID=36882 /ORGANISM="Pyramimonas obovata, Strain CCMP722" /LENGTH=233 /DNA_ID=CAMNT_0006878461 /DNA_START=288 /DNA_END=989 /DNA_ORIENTATION=+